MVIIYFGCFAVLWSGIAASLMTAAGSPIPVNVLQDGRATTCPGVGIVALAAHAIAVVLLAWKAHRWLFARGPIAVALCGFPLILLVGNVWFVPAFLYLIAVLHVWLASRHESLGRLQATRKHSTERGQA